MTDGLDQGNQLDKDCRVEHLRENNISCVDVTVMKVILS